MSKPKYITTDQTGHLYASYDSEGKGKMFNPANQGISSMTREDLEFSLEEVNREDFPKFAQLLNPNWYLYRVK